MCKGLTWYAFGVWSDIRWYHVVYKLFVSQMVWCGILVCWLCGMVWAAFPLMGWNTYVLEGGGVSCGIVWESVNTNYSSYVFAIFVFSFIVPLAIMLFSYIGIMRSVSCI